MKNQITGLLKFARPIAFAAVVLAGWCGTTLAHDHDQDDSSANQFFGSKELRAVFEDTYWRWVPVFGNGNVTLPKDNNGNAILAGVALMPYPNLPDGTNGSVDVTFNAGQSFFMPLIGLFGTSYTNHSPADPFVDVFQEKKLKLKLKLDRRTILDEDNAVDYYSSFVFNPPIPFNQFGVDSLIWLEGIGVLHTPLSPGKHVFKLDETLPVPAYGFTIEYHVTFNVTVLPNGH